MTLFVTKPKLILNLRETFFLQISLIFELVLIEYEYGNFVKCNVKIKRSFIGNFTTFFHPKKYS